MKCFVLHLLWFDEVDRRVYKCMYPRIELKERNYHGSGGENNPKQKYLKVTDSFSSMSTDISSPGYNDVNNDMFAFSAFILFYVGDTIRL
jgi:hypothetical protein